METSSPADLEEEKIASGPNTRKAAVRKMKSDPDEEADDGSADKKKNWSKYAKRYKPQWEKLEVFANWLRRTPDNLIEMGKPEAYCVLCHQCLRAHKSDLLAHAKSKKHKESENQSDGQATTPMDARSFVESYVPDVDDQAKSEQTTEGNEVPAKRSRGRPPKPVSNKAAILDQITTEFEETMEKIKVCEEELNLLRIKKARLELEFEYYNKNGK